MLQGWESVITRNETELGIGLKGSLASGTLAKAVSRGSKGS